MREADGVGVSHQVLLDCAGSRDEDGHFVDVILVAPFGRTGDGPDAIVVAEGNGFRRSLHRAVWVEQQAHALGGRRPHGQGRRVVFPGDAKRAVIGVQFVDHTRKLDAGGVDQGPIGGRNLHGQLSLEQGGHVLELGFGQLERQVAVQVRESLQHCFGQTGLVDRERRARDAAAHNAFHRQLHPAVEGVQQLKDGVGGQLFRRGVGDRVAADPVGAQLVDVAVGLGAGIGLLRVEQRVAGDDPGFGSGRQVKEHVVAGVLLIAAMDDESQFRGIWHKRHLPIDAEIALPGGRQGTGPIGGFGGVLPGMQAPVRIVAVGAKIVNRGRGLLLGQRRRPHG